MIRLAPRLMVLLLCGSALAGCASTSATAEAAKPSASDKHADLSATPGDLESSVRQAQLARVGGQYDQAVRILSQLMLVAADDPRVVSEYGKTLVEQGRATEAAQFLSRATELSPNDWTVYSALGVAKDQLGDQAAARIAYERALALKPGEPSVLNNYALSRMQANDPEGAHILIGRAQIAGGASDPKIARNIAMLNQLVPKPDAAVAYAVKNPAPAAMASSAPVQPIVIPAPPPVASTGAPRPLMAQQAAPYQAQQAAPRPQVAQQNLPALPLAMPAQQAPSLYAPYQAVVMQRVPVDPLAGPAPVRHATHAPRALAAAKPAADTNKPDAKGVAIGRPVVGKTADAIPAKPAEAKSVKAKYTVPALRMTADARNP